jgi:tetratricopeptide (TPR) repeat protein
MMLFTNGESQRGVRWLGSALLLLVLALLSGCVAERIRKDAQEKLRAGQYEAAMDTLDAGLVKEPDSALLKAGVLETQNEVLSRLIAEAGAARAEGRLDDAQGLLERALRFDGSEQRVRSLLSDLATERSQQRMLVKAEAQRKAGQRAAAVMSLVQSARINGHDPYAYMKDILTRLPTQKNSQIGELLPHRWRPA